MSILVASWDFLDAMSWDVTIAAFLLAMGSLMLHVNSKERRIDEQDSSLRLGFAFAAGASGFYLFVAGLAIGFIWPFTFSSGVYNVLFGGIAVMGGLVLLAGSVTLARNVDLRPVTYFAAIAGFYAVVDAYGILQNNLTSSPLVAALGYLGFAAPAILSVPAAQFPDKRWRYLFAVFAFLFTAVWLIQAATFTMDHL